MMMKSALFQTNTLSLYSTRVLKQQFVGRHIAPRGHIILIPSQPVFTLSPKCCVLSGEATNTNFILFLLIRRWLELTLTITPHLLFRQRFFFFTNFNFLIGQATLPLSIFKLFLADFIYPFQTVWFTFSQRLFILFVFPII